MAKEAEGNKGGQNQPKKPGAKGAKKPGAKGGQGGRRQNYTESTQKSIDAFLHARGAAKRAAREQDSIREQGAILFPSVAEAQAEAMVKAG
eukprot:SAG11_NODE_3440_length_2446_cov_17.994461_1_plen_91_part_00